MVVVCLLHTTMLTRKRIWILTCLAPAHLCARSPTTAPCAPRPGSGPSCHLASKTPVRAGWARGTSRDAVVPTVRKRSLAQSGFLLTLVASRGGCLYLLLVLGKASVPGCRPAPTPKMRSRIFIGFPLGVALSHPLSWWILGYVPLKNLITSIMDFRTK